MSAHNLIQSFGNLCGWTKSTMLDVLCTYIDNQQDNDTLADFLQQQADEEGLQNTMNPPCSENQHGHLRAGDPCPHCETGRVEHMESDGVLEIRCSEESGGCGLLLWDENVGDYIPHDEVCTCGAPVFISDQTRPGDPAWEGHCEKCADLSADRSRAEVDALDYQQFIASLKPLDWDHDEVFSEGDDTSVYLGVLCKQGHPLYYLRDDDRLVTADQTGGHARLFKTGADAIDGVLHHLGICNQGGDCSSCGPARRTVGTDYLPQLQIIFGGVKVEWVDCVEGNDGDYDPNDPDDVPLLRFDVSTWADGGWEEPADYSYCTRMPLYTDRVILLKALLHLAVGADEHRVNGTLKRWLQEQSWMKPEDFKEDS